MIEVHFGIGCHPETHARHSAKYKKSSHKRFVQQPQFVSVINVISGLMSEHVMQVGMRTSCQKVPLIGLSPCYSSSQRHQPNYTVTSKLCANIITAVRMPAPSCGTQHARNIMLKQVLSSKNANDINGNTKLQQVNCVYSVRSTR